MLASRFHSCSKSSNFKNELRSPSLERYSIKNSTDIAPELRKWNPSLFESDAWKNCLKCAAYYTSPSFHDIYEQLPTQVLHGDIHHNNIILSKGKYFLIDFDRVRTDVRLMDFALFLGWTHIDQYIQLTQEGKLFSLFQSCYGSLEDIEKQNLALIISFRRCCAMEWALENYDRLYATTIFLKCSNFQKCLSAQ